jgi:hypothetical protein
MPEGVQVAELLAGRDAPVASIHAPRVEEEAAPVVEATAAAATPGAAPAAETKEPAKGDAKK